MYCSYVPYAGIYDIISYIIYNVYNTGGWSAPGFDHGSKLKNNTDSSHFGILNSTGATAWYNSLPFLFVTWQ